MPVARYLAALTWPDQIRHGKVTQIEVAVTMVFGDGFDMLSDRLDDTRRYHDAPSVVKQDVVVAIALVSACDLAH